MKKYIISVIMFFFALIAKSQQPIYYKGKTIQDTIQYIKKTIIDKKQFYTGKPLNVLLDSMKLQVKSNIDGVVPVNRFISNNTRLCFDDSNTTLMRRGTVIDVIITWQTPVPMDSVQNISIKNHGEWTLDSRNYYGKQIVGDVKIGVYDLKE